MGISLLACASVLGNVFGECNWGWSMIVFPRFLADAFGVCVFGDVLEDVAGVCVFAVFGVSSECVLGKCMLGMPLRMVVLG